MSVQHHLISHFPEAKCGISLFFDARRNSATVVVTELPDNPGVSAERFFGDVIRKVRAAFLKGVPAENTAWAYRRPRRTGSHEVLFRVTVGDAPSAPPTWEPMDAAGLGALVNRNGGYQRRVFIPEFRPLRDDVGRRRHKELVNYGHLQ